MNLRGIEKALLRLSSPEGVNRLQQHVSAANQQQQYKELLNLAKMLRDRLEQSEVRLKEASADLLRFRNQGVGLTFPSSSVGFQKLNFQVRYI